MPAALLELSTPTLFPVLCGVLGLVVGSFLNVVIYRLPKMMEQDWQAQCAELCASEAPAETATANAANNISSPPSLSLARPGSHCPHCQHAITARENIPLLSWLCLRGRCSSCQHSISVRYPLVELLSASLSAYCAVHFGFGWIALGAIILVWCLIVLSLIDVDTQLLPDSITLPLLWLG
ncbi:MAG: prepilin peptidase, partial [Pseudomonadota bacterium]